MKKLVMISLVSTAALMMFAKPADAKTFDDKTDVGVSFKSDDATIPGENKPYKDNLSLVWKPNSFEFGEQKAVGGIATFNNTSDAVEPQYLVVNDDRPLATLPQWTLSAKLSEMKSTDKAATTLASKLTYTLGDVQSYDIGNVIDPATNDYVAPNPSKPEGENSLGILAADAKIQLGGTNQVMTLEAGNTTSQSVMQATEDKTVKGGYATQVKNTKLIVTDAKADKAAGKSFTGQVTWTLDDLQP